MTKDLDRFVRVTAASTTTHSWQWISDGTYSSQNNFSMWSFRPANWKRENFYYKFHLSWATNLHVSIHLQCTGTTTKWYKTQQKIQQMNVFFSLMNVNVKHNNSYLSNEMIAIIHDELFHLFRMSTRCWCGRSNGNTSPIFVAM